MPRPVRDSVALALLVGTLAACPRHTPGGDDARGHGSPTPAQAPLAPCVPAGGPQVVGQRAAARQPPVLTPLPRGMALTWLTHPAEALVPAGIELTDTGSTARILAAEPTTPARAPTDTTLRTARTEAGGRTGGPALLRVDALEDIPGPEGTGTLTRLRCGPVTDQPFAISHGGFESVVPGARYGCTAVAGTTPFVLTVGVPGDWDATRGLDRVEVFATPLAAPTVTAPRGVPPTFLVPVTWRPETPQGDVIRPFLQHLAFSAVAWADAPGQGTAVAFIVDGTVWTVWLDATLAAHAPPQRVPVPHGAAVNLALGWNGREALLVYDGDGALHAARLPPGQGAREASALPAVEIPGARNDQPAVVGMADGTWLMAWRMRPATAWGEPGGAVLVRRFADGLIPAPDAQTVIPGDAWSPQLAVRGEHYVLAAGSTGGQPAAVVVATGRCPLGTPPR